MSDGYTGDVGHDERAKCPICFGHGALVSDMFPSAEAVECWRCGGSGHV